MTNARIPTLSAHSDSPGHDLWSRQGIVRRLGGKRLVASLIHAVGRFLFPHLGHHPPTPDSFGRILVMNFHYLGDVFFTTPAIAGLKRRFPKAQIDVLVKSRGREIGRASCRERV